MNEQHHPDVRRRDQEAIQKRLRHLERIIEHPPGLGFTAIPAAAADTAHSKRDMVYGLWFAVERLQQQWHQSSAQMYLLGPDLELTDYLNRASVIIDQYNSIMANHPRYCAIGKAGLSQLLVRAVRTRFQMVVRVRELSPWKERQYNWSA